MRRWRRRAAHALRLSVAIAAGCAPLHGPPAEPAQAPRTPFILTFWCGPPLAEFDDERAAEIAAAGFTVVGAPCAGGTDPDLTLRALAVAERHGLRMWVRDHRFGPNSSTAPDWTERVAAAVAQFRNQPALEGYFVDDEPTASEFDRVAVVVGELQRLDPAHPAYVNLLPDYAPAAGRGGATYEDYVEQFIAAVRPRLLSYDYYPFGKEKDRSTFFANLETIRAAALRHDLPFMLIALAMPHGPYRDPTEAELAWQAHLALAYGARGISYFAYWTPEKDSDWDFHNGLIMEGRPTLHYFQAARLNRSLRALAGALTGFRSIAVADALGELGVPFPIGPIEGVAGGPVTAGLFGDGAGHLAVLLVNRDYRLGTTARIDLRAGASMPVVFDPESGVWLRPPALSFVLPPGGARLLCWGTDGGGCA